MKKDFLSSTEKGNKSKSPFDCLRLERYIYTQDTSVSIKRRKHDGLRVSVLTSGSSALGLSSGQGRCGVF